MRNTLAFDKPAIPPALPMKQAATYSHTSFWFIQKGVKEGTIKHFRSGRKVYVLIPALLQTLEELAEAESKGGKE